MTARPLEAKDLACLRRHARGDFAAVVKEVKNHLKAPLAEKRPVYLLAYRRLGQVGDLLVIEDASGTRLALTDRGLSEEPRSCHLLRLLPPELHENQAMVARFDHDLDTRQLRVKPLSIVSGDAVVRLTY